MHTAFKRSIELSKTISLGIELPVADFHFLNQYLIKIPNICILESRDHLYNRNNYVIHNNHYAVVKYMTRYIIIYFYFQHQTARGIQDNRCS